MGGNFVQALQQFMLSAKQQYGPNFDPSVLCRNVLGNNCATPQQALQQILSKGMINQAQYEDFLKRL